jgi:diguanylate cyclase (GGDEF)-like protein
MSKKNLFLLILIFLLALSTALIGLRNHQRILLDIDINKSHLENIILSSEMNSLVKRTEGHLLMFLLGGDPTDQDKFFDRMALTTDKINVLTKLHEDQLDIQFIKDNLVYAQEMLQLGKELVAERNEPTNQPLNMSLDSYNEKLSRFYTLSSIIRESGVQLMQISTDHINAVEGATVKELKYEYAALVVFLIAIFGLLLILGYQTNQLVVSRRLSQEFHALSNVDELTGIPNRRAIEQIYNAEWNRAIREKKPIGLMMIDIDNFKMFNDNYGHVEGDLCLVKIARTLQRCLKRSTDIIARYGGEEFLVVMPNTDNTLSVAEGCRQAIEQLQIPHEYSEIANVVTISIGLCSQVPDLHSGKEQFLRKADEALYQAKNAGRNRIHNYA